jgi:hypothetical protein
MRVVDENGNWVEGALVRSTFTRGEGMVALYPGVKDVSGLTDEKGMIELAEPPDGQYRVRVTKEGHIGVVTGSFSPLRVTLDPNEDGLSKLTLQVAPTAAPGRYELPVCQQVPRGITFSRGLSNTFQLHITESE